MNRFLKTMLLCVIVISSCAAPPATSPGHTPTHAPSPIPTHTLPASPLPIPSVQPTVQPNPILYTYKIVNAYPHDRNAFTQGLIFEDGVLYEGTGLRGRSTLRRVELTSGDVLQVHELPAQFFGEGITIFGDKIFQLTWQSHVGFVYDRDSFELLGEFHYSSEGWGLTHDGEHLIMSDGTSTLHFLDPDTLTETAQIKVFDKNGPVTRLNELEYMRGEIYANVWKTDRIARIDPETGQVTGWIELGGLLSTADYDQPLDVLNGIAYDTENERLFVTGKWWPKLFEITISVSEE